MSEVKSRNNINAFFALVRSGLWEDEKVKDLPTAINYEEVLRLADEQSVVGLVMAGVERLTEGAIMLPDKLKLLGKCQLTEQRNVAMNQFIGKLVGNTQEKGIKTLLVKGQGIAQCYERPLWRASGDVDLLFDRVDYNKAISVLTPFASSCKREERYSRHLGMLVDNWYVEIHGSLRTGLSSRIDKVVDAVQEDTFKNNKIRVWQNGKMEVLLPAHDNDVFFVFTHFIMHFYAEKMTLRQICDWCRLMWTYRGEIDAALLEKRLRKAGLVEEWKSFASMAVDYLGMPEEAMLLYEENKRWQKKGEKIMDYIISHRVSNKYKDTMTIWKRFPWHTLYFLPGVLFRMNRLKVKERLIGI